MLTFVGEMQFQVIHIGETDSTNRWLREYAQGNRNTVLSPRSPHCTAFLSPCVIAVADYQTAGRGCGKNSWESQRGRNLTFSMLLRPTSLPASQQFILSMAHALTLRRALGDYAGQGIKIKWPNDIYWHDRKICGTLIETTLQGARVNDCIIGTGININQRTFHSDAPNPVSLCHILGREVSPADVLQKVQAYTLHYLHALGSGSFDDIRAQYHTHLYRLGEYHHFLSDGRRFCAKILGVTPEGRLQLLEQPAGSRQPRTVEYAFKQVQFVIGPNTTIAT